MDHDREPDSEPLASPKLLGALRLKLQLAAVSGVVLGAGALLAPQSTRPGVTTSQERPVPLLEQEVQRREPARVFRPFREIARRVMLHNVTIPPARRAAARTVPDVSTIPFADPGPAGFGVIVDANGAVLTHASALGSRASLPVVLATGESVSAQLVAYEAATGLALLRLSDARGLPAAPIGAAHPEPGSVAATAARWQGRDIVAPVFVTSAGPQAYAIDAHGAALGGIALYNLEGEAFAIAGGAEQDIAFPLRAAVDRLSARAASGRSLDASIGVMFQPMTDRLRKVFGGRGVLVSRTLERGPADIAGITPGDLILEVGATPVDSPEAAQQAIGTLTSGTRTTIRVLRDSRTMPLTVVPGTAFEMRVVEPGSREPIEAPTAATVLSPEAAQAAGIAPDATILRINAQPVTSRAGAVRALARSRTPVLLYLEDQNERFFATVEERR